MFPSVILYKHSYLSTQLKQLQRELEEKDHEFASRTLEQVIERTEANIKWVTENKQIVLDWFSGELKN